MDMQNLYLLVPVAPLLGAIAAGLFGKVLGRTWSHRITIALVDGRKPESAGRKGEASGSPDMH